MMKTKFRMYESVCKYGQDGKLMKGIIINARAGFYLVRFEEGKQEWCSEFVLEQANIHARNF